MVRSREGGGERIIEQIMTRVTNVGAGASSISVHNHQSEGGGKFGPAVQHSLRPGSQDEKSPLAVTLLWRYLVRFCLVKLLPNKARLSRRLMDRERERQRGKKKKWTGRTQR